jgi:hypothetical protein
MRTTLTLASDVAERIRQETRRTGKTMKAIINEALRVGLGIRPARPRRFRVQAHPFGFRPGIDLDRMNQLLDEIEAADVARKTGR